MIVFKTFGHIGQAELRAMTAAMSRAQYNRYPALSPELQEELAKLGIRWSPAAWVEPK